MSNEKNNYVIQNGKLVNPDISDGCIGFWDFTLQKNIDNNRTMTPDLSGHGHHMYHNNMRYDELKLERLQNSTLHSEVVGKNSKGYHVYKYTPKTRTLNTHLLYDLVPRQAIKDKQTISATIYMKYEGNADKLKPSILIYKYPDENGGEMDLSGRVALNETMEQDSEGFYKLTASYTNTTGSDITNVSIVVYCANSTTSHLEDGHKPVTYFYIDSINDGVTSLRSGFFPSSGLVYDGIDDESYVEHKGITEFLAASKPKTLFVEFCIIGNKINYIEFFTMFSVYRNNGIFGLVGNGNIPLSNEVKTNYKYVIGVSIYKNKVSSYINGVKKDVTRAHNNVFNATSRIQTTADMSVSKVQLFDRYMTADEMEEILTNV